MKGRIFFVIVTFVLVAPVPVFGEGGEAPWTLLETGSDGVPVSYDSRSVIRMSGGKVRVALKYAYGGAAPSPGEQGGAGHCIQTVEVKCLEESYRVIESRSHDEHSSLPETGCPFPSG
jgi:hypothetical protein